MLRHDVSELRLYLWKGSPIPLKGNHLMTALGSTRLQSNVIKIRKIKNKKARS